MYNNACKTIGVLSHDFSRPQTAALLPGFRVEGFWPAVRGSIVV